MLIANEHCAIFTNLFLSGLPLLRGHLIELNRGLTVLETISGMSRNSPKSYGMRRSKIWTTKFHAPLDFCLSFSLLLVYSIFVPFLAGHLLSFSYIFACLTFRNISFPNNCFLFCVRETMVSRWRMCKSLAVTECCKRCSYIPFFGALIYPALSVGFFFILHSI